MYIFTFILVYHITISESTRSVNESRKPTWGQTSLKKCAEGTNEAIYQGETSKFATCPCKRQRGFRKARKNWFEFERIWKRGNDSNFVTRYDKENNSPLPEGEILPGEKERFQTKGNFEMVRTENTTTKPAGMEHLEICKKGKSPILPVEKNASEFAAESAFFEISWYCEECDISFKYPRAYERHAGKFHPKKKIFPCNISECQQSYTALSNLHRHRRIHHGITADRGQREPTVLHCGKCDKTFTTYRSFERHSRLIHGAYRIYKCPECPERFTVHHNMSRHIRGHRNHFRCTYCRRTYMRKSNMDKHVEKCGERLMMEQSGMNEGSYECERCGVEIPNNNREEIAKHRFKHTTHVPCPICGQGFSLALGWRRLQIHVEFHHAERKGTVDAEKVFENRARVNIFKNDRGKYEGKSAVGNEAKRNDDGRGKCDKNCEEISANDAVDCDDGGNFGIEPDCGNFEKSDAKRLEDEKFAKLFEKFSAEELQRIRNLLIDSDESEIS